MAVTGISVTELANWIPELWSDETLGAIQHATRIADTASRRYERMLKFGDTLNIPRRSNLTIGTKSEDTVVTFEAITEGVQQITVTTHQYVAIRVDDRGEVQSKYAVRSAYTENMGYVLARGMDTNIAALFQNYSQVVGTLGAELTDDNLSEAYKLLQQASAPDSPRYLPMSPGGVVGLQKVDAYRNQMYGGSTEWIKAGVPLRRIYGAALIETNLLRAAAAGQADAAMYHQDQNALIVQITPTPVLLHNPEVIEWQVVMHQLYGSAEINRPPETAGGGTAVDTWGTLLRTLQ